MIYILLIIIIIIILFFFYINKITSLKEYEYFESSSWTKSEEDIKKDNKNLTDNQINEVKNISKKISSDTLTNLISTQSPLLIGPPGPVGPPGPIGTTLIASGRLVNKQSSFKPDNKNKSSYDYVLTRTEGTNATSSLAFMDDNSPFLSYQDWQLDINNNIKNRFDNTCITMSKKNNKIYMDKCDPNNSDQKWTWDNTNRIISISNSTDKNLKCIGIKNEDNNNLTSIPNCVGAKCLKRGKKDFMVVKDCSVNTVKNDEVWGFI